LEKFGKLPSRFSPRLIANHDVHLEQLKASKIFISPRPAEGVGLSFLESISAGRVFISHRYPTMTEYASRSPYPLYFGRGIQPIKPGLDFDKIGEMFHEIGRQGRKNYEEKIENLRGFIERPARPRKRIRIKRALEKIQLSAAIYQGDSRVGGFLPSLDTFIKVSLHFGEK
jgi:hypothetical protein